MARIRTIKPEFCESESIGKLSREARLLFVLLWTILDDEGRSRASSRLLASRLYPYDDDAADLIDGWLRELQCGGHVRLYEVDGDKYLDVPKWLKHQKIDHKSKSRLPEFRETSRELAREGETVAPHTLDRGPVPGPSNSEAKASGCADVASVIFGQGLEWLSRSGRPETECRSLLGKWRKTLGDETLIATLGRAQREGAIDPIGWMEAAIKAQRSTASKSQGFN